MSLISVANFVAPFRQRFHLITIVLVTVVFAVLRLSGAAIHAHNLSDGKRPAAGSESARRAAGEYTFSTANGGAPAARVDDPAAAELLQALRAQQAAQARRPEQLKINPNTQGDLIENMMRPPPPPVAQNKADSNRGSNGKDSGNGSLSDIEKQLGLK